MDKKKRHAAIKIWKRKEKLRKKELRRSLENMSQKNMEK